MKSHFERDQECLFCGKAKTWRSALIGVINKSAQPLFIVTVCPDCRKRHTIQEIYEKVIQEAEIEGKK